jgi:hypothetical protein
MTKDSFINGVIPPSQNSVTTTLNDEVQEQFQFQADYVLPIERAVSLKRDTKETSIT